MALCASNSQQRTLRSVAEPRHKKVFCVMDVSLVRKLLDRGFNGNLKVSAESVEMVAELLRLLIVEAAHRSEQCARQTATEETERVDDDDDEQNQTIRIEPRHIQMILNDLLNDFHLGCH
jgi:CENP-S associating Centromere protein X